MEEIQTVHRGDDHGTIHDVEVQFVCDDPPLPTIDKLDGPVHRPELEGQHKQL